MLKNQSPQPDWDKHAIKAAIHRKGKTLTELAQDSGLSDGAIRVALVKPFPAGEIAISEFLGIPRHELWPNRAELTNANDSTLSPTVKARGNSTDQQIHLTVEIGGAA